MDIDFLSSALLLIMGRLFICRSIAPRGGPREIFDIIHQGITDGAKPLDLLLLFVNHIIQLHDGLFLKCDFCFNLHQTFFTHFYGFPPASRVMIIYLLLEYSAIRIFLQASIVPPLLLSIL